MTSDATENGKRVCVIMPAFNEAASVAEVIKKVKAVVPQAQVVVVNDGSTDDTTAQAAEAGAKVLELPFNLGIGGAVQTGLKYAWREGFEVAVEVDADGQHDPEFIPGLVAKLHEDKIDMVIGSRFVEASSYQSPRLRMFGIRLFSALIRLVTGQRIYDSTSGYRAYSRRAVGFLSRRYPADFPEPESIVMLLNAGYKVSEAPTTMGKRVAGESVIGKSDFNWRAAYFVISNSIAILVSGLKRRSHAG